MNNIDILYEDNHLIVAIKPCNVLSQADNTKDEDMLTILKKYLKEKYQKPGNVYLGLVHRLDRPTQGIMVFAKTSKAASRLAKQIQDKEFIKKYYAIINGCPKEKQGTLIDYIEKKDKQVLLNTKDGKKAILNYQIIEQKGTLSIVDITLDTGRYHQIRVQFASRGYPLYGDQLYGKQDKKQLALCAYYLSFIHPITKERLEFKMIPRGDAWQEFNVLTNR